VALSACAADGTFKSPDQLTQEERCMNLRMMLAIAQTNGASQSTLDKMKANIDLLCPPELGA
jgi:hypothetical protein